MKSQTFDGFDPSRVPSPCFVIDEAAVESNLRVLAEVSAKSGATILGALKAFSCHDLGAMTGRYLGGVCASGLHEARLAKEFYTGDGGEIHVYSAGYAQPDLEAIVDFADHVVFNSVPAWQRYRDICERARTRRPQLRFGLRINPEHQEADVELYDPCAPGSRLGVPAGQLEGANLDGISGLHFHTLCEQGFEPLARTWAAVEQKFATHLAKMEWLNLGGGHHITADGYNIEGLGKLVTSISERYGVKVYLEPGEAMAICTGVLVGEVLDVFDTDRPQAVLDLSATCHMPDTLEMPYRAGIFGAGHPGERHRTYRLGGLSCLAGDVIGDYSFDDALEVGQRLVFDDMSHYTMVKTTTFNGVRLPSIAIWNSETDALRVIRDFDYDDFKTRLG